MSEPVKHLCMYKHNSSLGCGIYSITLCRWWHLESSATTA